jgi:hypothetical protein
MKGYLHFNRDEWERRHFLRWLICNFHINRQQNPVN